MKNLVLFLLLLVPFTICYDGPGDDEGYDWTITTPTGY